MHANNNCFFSTLKHFYFALQYFYVLGNYITEQTTIVNCNEPSGLCSRYAFVFHAAMVLY